MMGNQSPRVSVIVPVLNEVQILPYLVKAVFRGMEELYPVEMVLVDSGSVDGTLEVAQESSKQFPIVVLRGDRTYAAAARKGIEFARGEVIVFLDASLEYDPDSITQLVKPILDDRADAVSGSRFLEESKVHAGAVSLIQRVPREILRGLSRLLLGGTPSDPFTNFLAIKRRLISPDDIVFDKLPFGLILFKATFRKLRLQEIPVYYRIRGRSISQSRLRGYFVGVFWQGIQSIMRARRM